MEAMFNGKHTLTKRDDVVFLDRDPDVFVMVVSYLRNGLIYPPIEDFVLKERFYKELEYWQLPEPKRNLDKLDDLTNIFEEAPKKVSDQRTNDMWKKHGCFDLKSAIKDGKISVNESLTVVKEVKRQGHSDYSGQNPTADTKFIGRWLYSISLYEGELVLDTQSNFKKEGFGRLVSVNNVFEGNYKENKRCGYGREIKANGEIREGKWEGLNFLGRFLAAISCSPPTQ